MSCWNMLLIFSIIFTLSASNVTGVKLFFYSPSTNGSIEIRDNIPTDLPLNVTQPIKVLCHGIISNSTLTSWYDPMIEAYLQKGYNVIAMDWGEEAYDGYITVTMKLDKIAAFLGNHIIKLHSMFSFPLKNVHIIGHSIAGHLAGVAGSYIYAKTDEKIGRVTGLDPPGLLFHLIFKKFRLRPDDAEFVDVVHSNAGGAGIDIPIGHADFYPDGGSQQNTCVDDYGCSHNISPDYYIESITSNNFVARKCNKYSDYLDGLCDNEPQNIMGEGAFPGISGSYYLTTNSCPPYGKGYQHV